MAQTLTASLEAHAKANTRKPSLSVVTSARRLGNHILRWERIYRAANGDTPVAAAVTATGNLIAARVSSGGVLFMSYPWGNTGANLGFWTSTATGLTAGVGVGLIARSGECIVAYPVGSSVLIRTSADNGVTWSSATTVVTEGSAVGNVSIAWSGSTSDACLFYNVGATVKRLRRTSGTWAGSGTNWTNTVASCTGLDAAHDGSDFVLLISGTENSTTHRRVWVTQMGDLGLPANAWGGLVTAAEADSGSNTTFKSPHVVAISGELRGSFAAVEAGNVSYSRVYTIQPPTGAAALSTWSEPTPFGHDAGGGVALAWGSGLSTTVYAVAASGFWRASNVGDQDDLSARALRARFTAGHDRARCTIELDNRDGGLAALPNSSYAATMVGGSVALTPGYASGTAGAAEAGKVYTFTVDALTYSTAPSRRTLTIEASGEWEQLAKHRNPLPWQTAAGSLNRSQVATRIAARAGITVFSASAPYGPSAAWTAYSPSFASPAGEPAASALSRLLEPVSDAMVGNGGALTVYAVAEPLFADYMEYLAPLMWLRLWDASNQTLVQDYSSTAAYPGAANNSVWTTFQQAGPLVGQGTTYAARFDGTNDFITGAAASALDLATYTVSALVKTSSPGSGVRRILTRRDGSGIVTYSIGLNNGVPWFEASAEGWNDTRGTTIADGEWHLFTVTKSGVGGTITWYIDGASVGTRAAGAGLAPAATGTVYVGSKNATPDEPIAATLAEVAIWDRALTAAEVASLWRSVNPAVVSFGGTDEHPITSLTVADEPPETNWSRLQGDSRYADASEPASLAQHGGRFRTVRNLDAGTNAKALDYTAGALRRAQWQRVAGELRAPWHPGVEVLDIVGVTHTNLAQDQQVYRALAVGLDFDPEKGRYDVILQLGNP